MEDAVRETAETSGDDGTTFLSYFSYFGRYTVREGAVVHHVESASIADWVGTDQVRCCEMEGSRLTSRTPPLNFSDWREAVLVAVWERMD